MTLTFKILIYCVLATITIVYTQPTWNISNLDKNAIEYLSKHHPMELLSVSEQMAINAAKYNKFRASITGVMFSGVFTDYTVLQREPVLSSLYGTSDTPNTQIILSMTDESNSKTATYNTQSMTNGDWKITLPNSYPNGGNYTFTVTCPKCKSNINDTISNVVFGDVFFCAGQSNMQCEIHFTFSQNYTYDNITKLNKYSNIRFLTAPSNSVPNETFVVPKQNKPQYKWSLTNTSTIEILKDFSATCFYTALQLSDNHKMNNINFGLIDVAVGGTMIESWTKNHTIDKYCTGNSCPGPECGGLYNGNVLPFINMTILTSLWYQGENNIGHGYVGDGGNWYNNTGYSCMENLMIQQWRTNFSFAHQTTPSDFPFGIVTLAAGTSEGHQPNMSHFRWSQSLNQDLLPSINGKPQSNMFMIQAHDIGDPWYSGCGANCQNAAAPYSANVSDGNGTNWKMGPIHPRPKMFVGERMARVVAKFVYGIDQIYSGPLISGCNMDINGKTITIMFNKTLMYGEELFYQKFDAWYNKSLNDIVQYQNAIQLNDGGKWKSIDDKYVSISNSNGPSVILDISSFYNGTQNNITGIQYAWSDYPCCGNLNTKTHPCPMNSCPFQTTKTRLPAIPFWAQIVDGKCKCFAPQVC
eukprot:117422_1